MLAGLLLAGSACGPASAPAPPPRPGAESARGGHASDCGLPSLQSGAVGAANRSMPLNILARDMGFHWLLFVADEVDSTWSGHAVSDRKVREQPEKVKRMLRVTLKRSTSS